jgi:NodT family efflux transporter outer membrane factor (OMF) lipoprotein
MGARASRPPWAAVWGTILTSILALAPLAAAAAADTASPPLAGDFVNSPLLATRAPARAAPALERWWDAFGDAELAALVDRALAQNLDLAQAEARLTQARAQAREAGAALLPAGQANAQGEYQHQSLRNPTARLESAFPGYGRDQQLYDLNASASWEVDLFGGLRHTAQAARAQYQASAAARAGARLAVAAATADAYVAFRELQSRLAVAQDQARAQDHLVALTRLQFNRGVAARLQVDQAVGGEAAVLASIPALEAALEAQRDALEVLVGVTPGSLRAELAAPSDIPAAPGVDAAGGPAALLRRRPDLIAAERRLAAADARIGAAVAEYYPKITLSGVLGYEASDIGQLVGPSAWQPQGIVGLRWRLFDFGRVDSEVAAARGARAEALAAYRQSVLQATADVESALVALVRREDQARVLGGGEVALARARDEAQAAYAAGHVSLIEVLDAEDRLLSARDQRLQARSQAARAAIAAFKALGGGWSA